MTAWDIPAASRFYRVPLVDFGPAGWHTFPDRRGVLIGSGCGLMTAVMDTVPFRWCVDTDDLRGSGHDLAGFLYMAQAITWFVGVCGWFSYSDPEPLRRAVLACPDPALVPVYFGGNTPLGVPCGTNDLADFLARCETLYHRLT